MRGKGRLVHRLVLVRGYYLETGDLVERSSCCFSVEATTSKELQGQSAYTHVYKHTTLPVE